MLIVPQHNHAHLTLEAVSTFRKWHPVYPVAIVDDGSEPDQADLLTPLLDERTQLLCQPHRGLTAAWNKAAELCDSPFLVFLNNDTITRGPWVHRLLAPLKDFSALMTGIRLREERLLPPTILERLPTRQLLEGWCFAIRRDDVAALGGFDAQLRLYFSDTDFQCRLLQHFAAATMQLHPLPDLPLEHLGHRTAHQTDGRRSQWQLDRSTFVAKWQPDAGTSCHAA